MIPTTGSALRSLDEVYQFLNYKCPRGIGVYPVSQILPADHSPAIPALEDRTVAQLQLAVRQRPGGGPGPVRGRQLRQRAQRDGQHCGCVRNHARSAISVGVVLRQRLCDAHQFDQP